MFLYLAKWFQRSRGSKIDQPEKELPMVAIFVNIPSINTSYQDPVYLAKRFQRRSLQCEKLTDDGRQVIEKRGQN